MLPLPLLPSKPGSRLLPQAMASLFLKRVLALKYLITYPWFIEVCKTSIPRFESGCRLESLKDEQWHLLLQRRQTEE